jgi:soluble P-type ATPase
MLTIEIPGGSRLEIAHLVLDYNGTIAVDGDLIDGVAQTIGQLSRVVTVHVVTADTHGTVANKLKNLPVTLHIIAPDNQEQAKLAYIERLGRSRVAAVGNGRNDRRMVAKAALGIAVLQGEGAFAATLNAASVICTSIHDALTFFVKPARLQATLRT